MNSFVRNSCDFRPFRKSLCLSVSAQKFSRAFVSCLLFWCRPPAILLGIAKVIVDPVNRMDFRRGLTHVLKKCREAISPSFTYLNAAVKILSLICWCSIFLASTKHHRPSIVFLCRFATVWITAMPMYFVGIAGSFFLQASTRQSATRNQFVGLHLRQASAIAFAVPKHFFLVLFCSTQNSQTAKLHSQKVFE